MSANATPMPARRGFLRNLVTLPLIGGGVTLIGNPTRAAEPVSRVLLDSYDAWLFYERRYLRFERYGTHRGADLGDDQFQIVNRGAPGKPFDFVMVDNGGGAFHGSPWPSDAAQPSSRAAIVLSAVGCDWREGDR